MSSAAKEKNPDLIATARELDRTPKCDEYDKMISGMLYDPTTIELLEARHYCRGVVQDFNSFDVKSVPWSKMQAIRLELLRKIVGRCGDGTFVEPPFLPDYGCNMIIGKNCFINFNFHVLDTSLVTIGDRVMFGPNVHIYTAGHETSVLSRIKEVEFGHPVYIEDDCWIGGNVTILPGVRIGKGCTVAAGSIVTRDIPAYSVAMGAPCRVRKTIETVEEEMADPNNIYRNMRQ